MKIFTKFLTSVAVSAFVAAPAAAVEFDVTYAGDNGSIKLSGADCSVDKEKGLYVEIEMFGDGFVVDPDFLDFDAGPNTGLYDAFVEGAELGEVDGEGTFIISKTGKDVTEAPRTATMGMSENLFANVADEIGDYAAVACKNFDDFQAVTCQQVKGSADWSKDGEQLQFKVEMQCMYENTNDKSQKVQARIVSGKLVNVDD